MPTKYTYVPTSEWSVDPVTGRSRNPETGEYDQVQVLPNLVVGGTSAQTRAANAKTISDLLYKNAYDGMAGDERYEAQKRAQNTALGLQLEKTPEEYSRIANANMNTALTNMFKDPAKDLDKVMLGTLAVGVAPMTLPELASGAVTAAANPYVDAALTSYFGAHGIKDIANGNANAMTALEVMPMIRLAKPLWNAGKSAVNYMSEIAPEVDTFITSPYTGKWATFGNRQYRFKPGNIGMNGVPVEARNIPEITAENAASITPEQWTTAQDAAIARGDMVEAQRLADLHSDMAAQKEGFSVYDTYHGQAFKDETYRSMGLNPYSDARARSGYFSVPSIDVARTYNQENGAPVFSLHTYLRNPFITDAKGNSWQQVPIYNLKGKVFRTTTTDKLANQALSNGLDGVIVKNVDDIANGSDLSRSLAVTDDYISAAGRNKLRDAVTYDDNGIRVPLGDRHNFNIKDTRWGILGPIVGATGYGLYDSFNSTNSDVHAYGGPLYKQWQDLSIKEKADMIKVGVKNGLTNMSDIRQKYNEFANGGNLYAPGGWRDIAKYHIRRNEGFRQHSYADAPKGKSWRSVGYGFNDSGFYSKYPMGISKYYDSRGGITKQEAEQELDYMLNIMEKQARSAYGSRWDKFNDNQKAAIMDTMYQRPASVLKGSQFHKAIMAGDPNAGNYLGVTGYANRNNIRRGLFGNPQITVPQEQQFQMQQPLIIPYESLNIQALNTPQTTQQPIIDLEAQRKQQELEERQQALAERAQAAETRQRGMENLMMAWRMLNEDTSNTGTSNSMPNMFTNNPYNPNNPYSLLAEGGNLYAAGGKRSIYDILPELYAMDGVNVVLSSGLRPNAVVYQNGKPTGRKSRHGSGQAADIVPGKGSTFADMFRVLRDPNSNVSRWMRANGAGFIDETSATGTTKYWHDHNRDHSHIHHQLGGAPASQYANMFKNIPLQQEPQQMQPVFMPIMTDPVLASYQRPVQQPQPLVDEATQKALLEQQERETALAEKQQAALEKQHNMQMFANVYDLLYNSGNNSSNTPTTYTAPNGNPFRFAAYGGEIKTK